MRKILENYGVEAWLHSKSKGFYQPSFVSGPVHECSLFDGHEDFTLVASARNPYSRMFSWFRFSTEFRGGVYKLNELGKFIEEQIYERNPDCFTFLTRVPDYFVRLESLVEDYGKIPFIRDSELYQSGAFKILCKTKMNQNKDEVDWRDFYDQTTADMVYYNYVRYFDIAGYDRNSWKK